MMLSFFEGVAIVLHQLSPFLTSAAVVALVTTPLVLRHKRKKERFDALFARLETVHLELSQIEPVMIGEYLAMEEHCNRGNTELLFHAWQQTFKRMAQGYRQTVTIFKRSQHLLDPKDRRALVALHELCEMTGVGLVREFKSIDETGEKQTAAYVLYLQLTCSFNRFLKLAIVRQLDVSSL